MAAGWDGRTHLSKALWIGLAVDERGSEVGEAFAVMRLDFASVVGLLGWRPVLEPPTLCLSALSTLSLGESRPEGRHYDLSIGT